VLPTFAAKFSTVMRQVKNWVAATFILCFLVILAGGIVRTTQSGMGCPDWPKCFGKWIPPTDVSELPPDYEKYLGKQDIDHSFNAYHTWIEYVNRLLGVLLGVFAIIQLIVLYRYRSAQKKSWRLALLFLGLVILTGLFGAIVVKLNLAHVSISVHLLFAILLVQVQLALWMTLRGTMHSTPVSSAFRRLLWISLTLVLVQAILGTAVRMHIDDISKLLNYQEREKWLLDDPAIFLIHRTLSWLLLLDAIALVRMGRPFAGIKNYLNAQLVVLLLAMTLGIILYYAHMPAFAQPLHLLLAAVAITQWIHLLFKTTAKSIT
jgi:cytochrome c oxidase assembly protein subunit 15